MKLDRTATNETTKDFPLLEPGEYLFQVQNAEHTTSQSGNWMWKLQLRFEQANGADVTVFDYLVENDRNMWKFNAYLDSIGSKLTDTSKLGDTIGEIGRASVEVEKGTNGYSDRNRVKRYIKKEEEKKAKKAKAEPAEDLPF
jgi:hypothetical protein